jgi:hypothetical protein
MTVLGVTPRPDEVRADLPGDGLVPSPDVVMDRAFSLAAPTTEVWPWFAQLGKGRSGWYLPRWAERLVPPGRRALRAIDPSLLGLRPGDVIDDRGGAGASFEIVRHAPPTTLVHRSSRGAVRLSWARRCARRGSARPGCICGRGSPASGTGGW